jgi:hypothetical protein
MMFAGGAYTNYRDAAILFCGSAPCEPKNSGFTYTFGVDVWLTRFVGLEGTYIRPHEVEASGGDGATYAFNTTMESDVWTVAGKVGAQAGVVRIYGKGGLNYHQATTRTDQRIENVPQIIEYRTTGWSWLFGGGMEAWMGQNQRLAIFADAGIMRIKGGAEGGGEAEIDDRLKYVTVGVKLRLSR